MESLDPAVMEYVMSNYYRREKERVAEEARIKNARKMLFNWDFMDRLALFMSDLSHLTPEQGLDKLPHHGLYFSESEQANLAKYTCLCDDEKRPSEILESFREVFPSYLQLQTYVDWIQNVKECIPGTLEGVNAKEILRMQLEDRAAEREEIEKAKREQEAKMRAVQKRRETLQKKKMQQNGKVQCGEGCEGSMTEGASSPTESSLAEDKQGTLNEPHETETEQQEGDMEQ
jgi:hypothetical protein